MKKPEPESTASIRQRRRQRLRRLFTEAALAMAFLAAVFAAERLKAGSSGGIAPVAAVLLAAGVLALWFFTYTAWHRTLDEFERKVQLLALALAGGGVVWLAALWGVVETVLCGPDLPLFLLAPIFALLYAAIHIVLSARLTS